MSDPSPIDTLMKRAFVVMSQYKSEPIDYEKEVAENKQKIFNTIRQTTVQSFPSLITLLCVLYEVEMDEVNKQDIIVLRDILVQLKAELSAQSA